MDWKLDLYAKIAPHLGPRTIVASNTSGLSISKMAEALPEAVRPRFCGIHFFNPPRYMYLVELIATPSTDAQVLDDLETFVTSGLGKGVVRAKDSPNFIANRVGIAGMLATMAEADRYGLSYDVVDDLTGKKMGRAGSGTFRTADVATSARKHRRVFTRRSAATCCASTQRRATTSPPARSATMSTPACLKSLRPNAWPCFARPKGRKAAFSGPCFVTAFITPRCTWAALPTPLVTSTSRCAGALA
jgi:3-hydroxyacyl-CoA dehydrogenase